MSTLHVENLKGLSSGGNANKIIVPSGQTIDASAGTLVPSAGHMVQHAYNRRATDISTSSNSAWVATGTITFTPLYANSLLELYLNYSLGRNQQGIRWRFYDSTASYQIERTGVHKPAGVNTDADPARHTFLAYYTPNNTNTRNIQVQFFNETGDNTVWGHTYGGQTGSFFVIREIKQ